MTTTKDLANLKEALLQKETSLTEASFLDGTFGLKFRVALSGGTGAQDLQEFVVELPNNMLTEELKKYQSNEHIFKSCLGYIQSSKTLKEFARNERELEILQFDPVKYVVKKPTGEEVKLKYINNNNYYREDEKKLPFCSLRKMHYWKEYIAEIEELYHRTLARGKTNEEKIEAYFRTCVKGNLDKHLMVITDHKEDGKLEYIEFTWSYEYHCISTCQHRTIKQDEKFYDNAIVLKKAPKLIALYDRSQTIWKRARVLANWMTIVMSAEAKEILNEAREKEIGRLKREKAGPEYFHYEINGRHYTFMKKNHGYDIEPVVYGEDNSGIHETKISR